MYKVSKPTLLKKYTAMSKQELWEAIHGNLWFTPAVYALFSLLLVTITIVIDYFFEAGSAMGPFFSINSRSTTTIVSTLTAGILTLTTFTFNSILVVFTAFSGQFSPRVLKNFISSKATQRVLGIFNGSFLYMLISFLFMSNEQVVQYFTIPYSATLLAALSAGTFVFFINHSVRWLQVNNMTQNMKKQSLKVIQNSLEYELAPYRVKNPSSVHDQIRRDKGKQIFVKHSGYIQLIRFIPLIKKAQQENLLIKMEYRVGDFAFHSTPLLTYWEKEDKQVDESEIESLVKLGDTQTEIQDIGFSVNKLVEVAIRSLGNHDPKTAINTIYQICDLLLSISHVAKYSRYLVDEDNDLRLILQDMSYDDYLYAGLAYIRHYARENVIITVEILKALNLMAKSANSLHYQSLWDFAVYTAHGFEQSYLFEIDSQQFLQALFDLAQTTGNMQGYNEIVNKLLEGEGESQQSWSEAK